MKKSEQKNILDIPKESFFELCQGQFSEKKLFILETGKTTPDFLTGKMLAQKAMLLGNILQQKVEPQGRAIIIMPQGLEYIYTLLACFYANVIAVPIPVADVLNSDQVIDKVNSILKDSQATCIITDAYCQEIFKAKPDFSSIFILNAFDLTQAKVDDYQIRTQLPEDIAILLYTSGSTSLPKGVMISHHNLKVRALVSTIKWQIHQDSCIVSWLPQYHSFAQDLNIFCPMLKGATSVIQAPNNFIKNPHDWLLAIDRYLATHTGAPNFAFDYCCSSIENKMLEGISLKSLQLILSGGEPIRRESCENFYTKFKEFGLQKNVFCPIYGLSEMGTVVTKTPGKPMQIISLDIPSLEQGKVKISDIKDKGKLLTSCGEVGSEIEIQIVHPENCTPCLADEIGEIWIKSPAIGRGYFNRKEETKDTFFGTIKGVGKSGFLRTGDLGFIKNAHLYIVGREKEVIIIHGKNYHPVDIEWTIKNKLTYLDQPIAVFSCEIDQQERVIVVQEFESGQNDSEYKKVVSDILSTLSLAYQIETYDIVLVSKNSIPRTGSAKIQRKACGNAYINNKLNILYQYRHRNVETEGKAQDESSTVNKGILDVLKKDVLTAVIQISDEMLETAKSFNELGLNSIQYIRIAKRIEEIFKIEFNPILLFEYKDFTSLTQYLVIQTKDSQYQNTTQSVIKNDSYNNCSNKNEEEIAIIGISCNFPGGANNPDTYWNNLIQQKDSIVPITDRACIVEDYQKSRARYEDSLPQWAGFIKDVDAFDAPFFHISTLEAESMDPQQRKILELTWSVIEDSGYNPRQLSEKNVGLFIGVHQNDYAELVSRQTGLIETYGAFLDSGLHMTMITNRVSRWLDFHGPSEIVNTACSSSLVAVHHAVESILNGECSLAIAGGINLLLSSRTFCAANMGGMLSKDGRCKSFDKAANGFVRAEGYGAILLKPVSQAKADGDTIYGIIKGTAINHDGQSNSLRAPNLTAQKQLIKAAYQKAKVSTLSVSYIETHGTGTELGDPIEIQALREAFQEMGESKTGAYCALGSVKTNIGHLESAAGIAGLIKILLSIKHQTIPGILHFKQINPYISLNNSPFFIANEQCNWRRLHDVDGIEMPLRAGISSFGFGGANAHVIIEEFISEKKEKLPIQADVNGSVVIVLSAKSEERLQEQAKRLLALLDRQQHTDADMVNIAYTLQIGREAMEERLGLIVNSIKELSEKLQGFIKGEREIKELYRGQVIRDKGALALFTADEDMVKAIDVWVEKKKYGKLLELWVKGFVFEWKKLYSDRTIPQRISLPTYPFAQDRYWIADAKVYEESHKMVQIHPLVHTNTSNFAQQCFSSVFSGEEFFLKDHLVKIDGQSQQKVLPGVTFLEMARVAIEQAMPTPIESSIIELHNTVWIQPVTVTQNKQVIISLFPNDENNPHDKHIDYEVYSQDKEKQIIHCQGSAIFIRKPEVAQLNIKELKNKMQYGAIDAESMYSRTAKMGISYGSSFQGIVSVYKGENQILAQLRLPFVVESSQNDYLLHPSLMDSALQSSICLIEDLVQQSNRPPMPFALESVRIISACTKEMFAWVRYSLGNKLEDTVNKFDIDICDLQGNVCVQMKGFSTRVSKGGLELSYKEPQISANREEIVNGLQHFIPIWNPVSISNHERITLSESAKILLLGGSQTQLDWVKRSYPNSYLLELSTNLTVEAIQAKLRECSFDQLLWLAPDVAQKDMYATENDEMIINNQEKGVLFIFRTIKALLQLGYVDKVLQWTFVTSKTQKVKRGDSIQPTHAGIFGLIGSLAKEYLHWNLRLLDLDSLESVAAHECLSLPWNKNGNGLAFRQGEWFCQELARLANLPQEQPVYKQKGVYVVIGGAGGVGEVWSRFMIENYQAKMVWIDRQEYNEAIKDKIKSLGQLGNAPLYLSADATNFESLERAFKKILETYPTINGVVHSAIILKDQSITHMEESIFRASLSAKVDISVNMNRVFGGQELDFILFFSSMISFDKSAGQSNYAAGCTFKDSYAQSLQQKHSCLVKIINWGYWGMMGIVTNESYKRRMAEKGIGSIEPHEGMNALQTLVGSELSQMVLHKILKTQVIADLNVTETVWYYPKATTCHKY